MRGVNIFDKNVDLAREGEGKVPKLREGCLRQPGGTRGDSNRMNPFSIILM